MGLISRLFFFCSTFLSLVASYSTLSNHSLLSLPGPGNDFDIYKGSILAPILIPRVPGTPGQVTVQNHIVSFFRTHLPKWKIELHNSTSVTPTSKGKQLPFTNIIVTRDPPWASDGEVPRLALAAHYDSKLTPEGFIGAVDSAAPVAMMMHAARILDTALTKKWEGKTGGLDEDSGVQLLFLDGEEAFLAWTDTDSLYGARALAETWEKTLHPAMSTYHNPLSSISLFVLLDLLGAKDPSVPSYYKVTHWAYEAMANAELRLRELGQFKSSPNHASKRATSSKRSKARGQKRAEHHFLHEAGKDTAQGKANWLGGMIGDDHVPFMARGVEILHIIPSPFPSVWHEITDDGEHLDMDTVEDWTKLVIAFAAEWLELEGFLDTSLATRDAVQEEHIAAELDRRKAEDKTELHVD